MFFRIHAFQGSVFLGSSFFWVQVFQGLGPGPVLRSSLRRQVKRHKNLLDTIPNASFNVKYIHIMSHTEIIFPCLFFLKFIPGFPWGFSQVQFKLWDKLRSTAELFFKVQSVIKLFLWKVYVKVNFIFPIVFLTNFSILYLS